MHLVKATAWNWAAEGRWSGEKDIDRVTFLGYFRSSFTSYFFLSLTAFRVVLFLQTLSRLNLSVDARRVTGNTSARCASTSPWTMKRGKTAGALSNYYPAFVRRVGKFGRRTRLMLMGNMCVSFPSLALLNKEIEYLQCFRRF